MCSLLFLQMFDAFSFLDRVTHDVASSTFHDNTKGTPLGRFNMGYTGAGIWTKQLICPATLPLHGTGSTRPDPYHRAPVCTRMSACSHRQADGSRTSRVAFQQTDSFRQKYLEDWIRIWTRITRVNTMFTRQLNIGIVVFSWVG